MIRGDIMSRFLVAALLAAITALLWISYDFASTHRVFGSGAVSTILHAAAALSAAALFIVIIGQILLRYGFQWVLRLEPTELQRRLVITFLTFIATATVLAHFGFDFSSILVFSALITAVVGLSLQPMLGSMVSGLAVDRAVRIGDGILLNGESVEITSLNWRSVVGRRADGSTIVLPNIRLTDNTLEVLPRDRSVRAEARFDVSMAIPPHRLQKIAMDLIADLPESDPSQPILLMPLNLERTMPFQQMTMGDGEHLAGRYRVLFSVRHFTYRVGTEGRVLRRLWYAVRRENAVGLSTAMAQRIAGLMPQSLSETSGEAVLKSSEALLYDDGERIALPARLEGHACLLIDGTLAESLSGRPPTRMSYGLTREASLGRIKQLLSERIGPYAEHAVNEAAATGADLTTVCNTVAEEIDDADERAKFLEAASPPPERFHRPGLSFRVRRDGQQRLLADLPLRAVDYALILAVPEYIVAGGRG
jgi:small-conductance mechanosensitive channel